ncbi:MAG: PhnD/SsuA/transferrin family substrate-binding protein [Betaproteobacteria bacterium]|nr:PhnD/SsuA/transferrin family substrate-binding protein [Betaproteobacteria bacterium]
MLAWALRRAVLPLLAALLVFPLAAHSQNSQNGAPVRIGLTPVFLDDQTAFLNVWREYLEKRLQRPVVFVQRGSYREITDLLRQEKLDFAWVCGLPMVENPQHMKLLAVPVFKGKPLYQSYLIVPASDQQTRSILDLRGKVFAFSDPDSNSGYLFPSYALFQLKERPSAFFSRSFFTWAHRQVVEAVAAGLAQGGAVDGYVWETLQIYHPELTGKTRVVQKSPEFGHTPFVARWSVPRGDFGAMQRVLVEMSNNAEGTNLLKKLNLDGFTPGELSLFDSIANMAAVVRSSIHAKAP